jgi:hypothetical protein
MNTLRTVRAGMLINSDGLRNKSPDQLEIQLEVEREDLVPSAEEFVFFVSNYIARSGRAVLTEETLAYGYWLIKFREQNGVLTVWEYNPPATHFIKGATLTLTYWRDQHKTCEHFNGQYTPFPADKLTVVDEGVLMGRPIEAVRYSSPEHMSGWWITSDQYTGDSTTLRPEHTYHLTAARPEIARYLALPYGFRFTIHDKQSDAWLDEQVLLI